MQATDIIKRLLEIVFYPLMWVFRTINASYKYDMMQRELKNYHRIEHIDETAHYWIDYMGGWRKPDD